MLCGVAAASALSLCASCSVWSQKVARDQQLAGTESIDRAVRARDKAAGSKLRHENTEAVAQPVVGGRPIHILYKHGINHVGAGASLLLQGHLQIS